ncbi:hypothetical protein V6N12_047779 [Hibiscus sabdariffa]|uniref:RNase H type-1 domain-containing protein n=1 Tax=Hibiscus sabdariffa TaxID=183260 RepID=A0ABR2CTZ4_9ROSI
MACNGEKKEMENGAIQRKVEIFKDRRDRLKKKESTDPNTSSYLMIYNLAENLQKSRRDKKNDIGFSLILEAELWGILKGQRIAWFLEFERVQCQTDSLEAYDLITSRDASSSPISLVHAIADYSSKSWMLDYVLIKRDANFAAVFFQKFYPALDGSTSIYFVAPAPLVSILVRDLHGPLFFRHCDPMI